MDITDDPLQTTRDLLDRRATVRHGFFDVLGESVAPDVPTLAQRAMNSVLVAGVYERLWRPTKAPRAARACDLHTCAAALGRCRTGTSLQFRAGGRRRPQSRTSVALPLRAARTSRRTGSLLTRLLGRLQPQAVLVARQTLWSRHWVWRLAQDVATSAADWPVGLPCEASSSTRCAHPNRCSRCRPSPPR